MLRQSPAKKISGTFRYFRFRRIVSGGVEVGFEGVVRVMITCLSPDTDPSSSQVDAAKYSRSELIIQDQSYGRNVGFGKKVDQPMSP